MLETRRTQQVSQRHRLITAFARNVEEIVEAQRLRHKVFSEEMGAFLQYDEIDRDIFDKFCEHLLVRESDDNRVIGTCRLLAPDQAKSIGGYYSQTGFDLTRLMHLRASLVEAGRACMLRNFQDDSTFAHLWSGIAQYMKMNRCEYLISCVSVSIADGGHNAASLYRKLIGAHASPIEYRVFPRNPLPLAALDQELDAVIPPLLQGYLNLGACICGEPAWDATFNTADLLVLLPLSSLEQHHARHFRE